MKKGIYLYALLSFIVLYSCKVDEYDNYDAPNAEIYGTITDGVSGEAFQTEQPDGVRIVFIETKYETPEPIKIWAKYDGTYRNAALFNGKYDVYLDEIAGVPSSKQTVNVTVSKEVNFTVTPFLSVDTISIKNYGKTVKINYRIEKNLTDQIVEERAIFINSIDKVSQRHNILSAKKKSDADGEFTDKIIVPEFGSYYLRCAAKTKNAYGRYNYSKVIKIEVVDNGLEDPDGGPVVPGVEEGRIFESFMEVGDLDGWETKYNFETEFIQPEKVQITMGTIDGYGVFAKPVINFNVNSFPFIGIKVFSSPPDENWMLKMYDGLVDVVLRASEATGVKDLSNGSKIYYWDITAFSDWKGEVTSNLQIAVEGSATPLVFGWIRSFENDESVEDEDFYAEGRIYELFKEEEALGSWETKYNFATEFIESGKVQITMGTIDGYGVFAKPVVSYSVDDFPIIGIRVFNSPPDGNWMLKMYDGQVDVTLSASTTTGVKELYDGSKVYYWDITAFSDWKGEVISNVQIAVAGSATPLVFGWVKTFKDEDSIK